MLIVAIYRGSRAVCCVLRVLRGLCKLCVLATSLQARKLQAQATAWSRNAYQDLLEKR